MKLFSISSLKNKHFLALVGNLVISGFSVLTIAILYRILTKSDTGIWFFFLTVLGLAEAIRTGFLTTATVKFYAGTSLETGKQVLGSVWYLAILLTAGLCFISLILFLSIGWIHNPELVIVIKWFAITFISSLFYNVSFWILIAEEDYLKILWLRLINSGSMILIILILAYFKMASLYNLLLINFLTNCLTSLVAIVWGYTKIGSLLHRNKAYIKEITDFGKYSLGTNLSSNLLSSINTFVITFMLGPAVLAVYNLPQRLMEIVEIPLRSFVGTGMSAMATAYNTNNLYHLYFVSKKYAGVLMFAFIPIVFFAFISADLAVKLLGGGKYVGTEAANIFRLLMFFSLLYPIDRFNGVTLDILHQKKVNFYKVLVMIAANLPIAFIGIFLFHNIWGVAIATPFTLLAGLLFGYYHLKKHMEYSFKEICKIGYVESLEIVRNTIKKFKK